MENSFFSNQANKNVSELVNNLRHSREFQNTILSFKKVDSKSLMEPSAQAFIYELVKKLNIKSALEIGTYFAGSAKVIVEAMEGRGILITLDSNQERKSYVETEIASWPAPLKESTFYVDTTSSSFFNESRYKEDLWFDFCFIDGDHSYTSALTDLINCARFSGPQAIILLDDAVQPAVFTAAKDFLNLYPDWCEIGDVIESGKSSVKYPSGSFPGLPFLILAGPRHPSINSDRYSFHTKVNGSISGIKIDLATPATEGCLEGRFLLTRLNDFGPNHRSEDVNSLLVQDTARNVENGDTSINLTLDEPYRTNQNSFTKIDAHLFWKGTNPQSALALSNPPSVLAPKDLQ